MRVFTIPNHLANAYRGSGYALAAVARDELAELIYLRDVLPDHEDTDADGDGTSAETVAACLSDVRLALTIQHLARIGEVLIGMCSCWEFVEL